MVKKATATKSGESGRYKPKRAETITGAELKEEEDSPGNFTVEKRRDMVVIRVYDRIGMVLITECPIAASGESSTNQ